MSIDMDDVLKRIGWESGFHVPVANAENQALEQEVEKLTLQRARGTQAYENALIRFESLQKHLKFVHQQNEENQTLLAEHRQQLDIEEHQFRILSSEKDGLQQEIRQSDKETGEVGIRNDNKKSDLSRGMQKIEKLKAETTWDAEALEAWEESLKKRDVDNELLQKYSKEDDRKAKELEARRQNLRMEVVGREGTLAKMMADITNYEQMMERTGKLFKQQRVERAALMKQWSEAVKHLKQRDRAIHQTEKQKWSMDELLAEKRVALEEENDFLVNEIQRNKALEAEIEAKNLANSRTRRELNELTQFVLTLNSEVNAAKRMLAATAGQLEKERALGRNMDQELNFKEYQIKRYELEIETLSQKLSDVQNSSMSAAEKAKQKEQIIEQEQRQAKALTQDIERMQIVLFRSQQVLSQAKDLAKSKEMEIGGCETATTLLRKHVKNILLELQRQKEIIYDLDFRINELEGKLARLEGQSDAEEKQAFEDKIIELEKVLAEHTEIKMLLQGQVTRTEDEMRRLSNSLTGDSSQSNTFKNKLQDQMLLFEGGRKQLAAVKLRSQQRQVEENVLRLRVTQLETIVKREHTNIYSLQKFRLELETAMREREIEINTNKDILLAKRRNLDEEKGRLKCDIMSRHIKIDQIKKKHHIAIMALGRGDDGEPLSVTHFKIKSAQEKSMLQQQGDELDGKIRKAEKEIVAMENTLKIVNATNTTYKKSLSAVDEDGEEIREKETLEQQINENTVAMRKMKHNITAKRLIVKDLQDQLKTRDLVKTDLRDILTNTEDMYAQLERDAQDKQEKLNRADRHLTTICKNLSNISFEKHQKNLKIRQYQDSNNSVLQQLNELSARYQEVTPLVDRYMMQHNLRFSGSRMRLHSNSSMDSLRSSNVGSAKSTESAAPSVTQVVLEFGIETGNNGKRQSKTKIN